MACVSQFIVYKICKEIKLFSFYSLVSLIFKLPQTSIIVSQFFGQVLRRINAISLLDQESKQNKP